MAEGVIYYKSAACLDIEFDRAGACSCPVLWAYRVIESHVQGFAGIYGVLDDEVECAGNVHEHLRGVRTTKP